MVSHLQLSPHWLQVLEFRANYNSRRAWFAHQRDYIPHLCPLRTRAAEPAHLYKTSESFVVFPNIDRSVLKTRACAADALIIFAKIIFVSSEKW